MRQFAELYARLDESTSTIRKVAVMAQYFAHAQRSDAALAVYFLAGGKPRRIITSTALRDAAAAVTQISDWLFDECYQAVGDLAETIALLLPAPDSPVSLSLAQWVNDRLIPLRTMAPEQAGQVLAHYWTQLSVPERLVMNKLLTGSFRVGVSRLLVTRAVAQSFTIEQNIVAQRMIGYTDGGQLPGAVQFERLIAEPSTAGSGPNDDYRGHPYPFFLAQTLSVAPQTVLGDSKDWLVEWKWDGIRVQLVKRDQQVWLWSRGEELITERFPEIAAAATHVDGDWIFDGELLAWNTAAEKPLPFTVLQKRIARKTLGAKFLRENPVMLIVYEVLQRGSDDLRTLPQAQRRAALHRVFSDIANSPKAGLVQPTLALSPSVSAADWIELTRLRNLSRSRGVEGFMLKRNDAPYGIGRIKGDARGYWWKWKVDPYSIDAVLLYAQRGHGRRASLYTDYTFALWHQQPGASQPELVPFAKAYSGLTDQEIGRVDAIIRKTTVEKFGPVRSVTPSIVFELGFENISLSTRHKSGIAVRFPRILRWREDKTIAQANTLDELKQLLEQHSNQQ
jgi:DNA ligase 1